jgi:hypothetical protein
MIKKVRLLTLMSVLAISTAFVASPVLAALSQDIVDIFYIVIKTPF